MPRAEQRDVSCAGTRGRAADGAGIVPAKPSLINCSSPSSQALTQGWLLLLPSRLRAELNSQGGIILAGCLPKSPSHQGFILGILELVLSWGWS